MNLKRNLIFGACLVLSAALIAGAEVKTTVERNQGEKATADFKFKSVPSPSKTDAAEKAKFEIVEGDQDQNGGDLSKLHDGKGPTEEDQPEENFFFTQNADGGRILIDLEKPIEIHQVNTYSWHANTRAPQVYKLYASDGKADGFDAHPKRDADMEKAGWKQIASVDTRPKEGEVGGQYGVSISDSDGAIGTYRYLLFDVRKTESDDPFGNTFYSEIDVLDHNAAGAVAEAPAKEDLIKTLHFGKYECVIDYSQAPEFKDWVNDKLAPVVEDWYPRIVKMLPSKGYEAPTKFSITFHKTGRGVAATGGTRIFADVPWFSHNLDGEAVGALVHEMVHVVQQYGRTRMAHRQAQIPGWLVEAIPDYIRWFLYEPQSHGADHVRNPDNAKYNSPYRVGANFLNFVTVKYDKDLVPQLNEAIRDGKYNDEIWTKLTGKSADDLGEEWKAALKANHGVALAEDSDGAPIDPNANQLTEQEKKDGWVLLFDGKDTDGWHSFKRDNVRPGWEVKDGTIACVDPHNAGDLCTNQKFGWFELQLDYNISVGGNSGILYHVTDAGGATWATGPEFQLEDNVKAADPIRCGWLYALYKPPVDPDTGKTLDATKPAGQWNHVRLLVSPEKCEHDINGVKYFDYVLNSDDFKERVAKSKFHTMPNFAKFDSGFIALQGDHGRVAFRNVKIRPIEEK